MNNVQKPRNRDTEFSSKYISLIHIQCGEFMALSKWLPAKYDPTLPSGYQKVAYPPEISFWIRNLFTRGKPLPGCFASTAKPPVHRVDVVYRDVITGSRESRDHHYDAPLIHRILKSLLLQNNTFFIATASVVKDAADNPDCQGLRGQWYYLRLYVRRTMPPTVWVVCTY